MAEDTAMESMEGAVELQPLVDGIKHVADFSKKNVTELDAKIEKATKKADRDLGDFKEEVNKSMENILARVNHGIDLNVVKLSTLGVIRDNGSGLNEVVSKSFKDQAGQFEAAAREMPKGSALSDPLAAMAVTEWFQKSTRLGMRKFMSTSHEDAVQAEKLYASLQEKHFGSNWQSITKAAYSESDGTGVTGGTLVPTIVEADLIRQIKDAGKLYPRARQIQMNKRVHQMPSESGAVTVGWAAEEGALTQGEGTINSKTLTAKKVYGRAKMSIELVEDSNVGLLAYLLEVFTEKIAGELDKQVVCGDGSSPAITGIDNTTGINVISSSATAAGRNLTWQLLVNTFVGNGEGVAIENGVWIMSPKGYATLFGISDTTGQPIVKDNGAATSPAGTLLGRPIIMSARFGGTPTGVTATLDDSTNANTRIIYGVPSSLLFGTRQGFRWDVTDQVGWANYQMDARLTGRFAAVVGVAANFSRLTKINY